MKKFFALRKEGNKMKFPYDLNTFGYVPWKYPSNWLTNIKTWFRNRKYKKQRIRRGYADCDVWDMNSYLGYVTYQMLKRLSANHWGFPGNEEFPDDASWVKELNRIASLIGCIINDSYVNEYDELANLMRDQNEWRIKWQTRQQEINTMLQNDRAAAFKALEHIWDYLWD